MHLVPKTPSTCTAWHRHANGQTLHVTGEETDEEYGTPRS